MYVLAVRDELESHYVTSIKRHSSSNKTIIARHQTQISEVYA